MILIDRSRTGEPEVLRSLPTLSEKKRLNDLLRMATEEHLAQLRVTFDSSIWIQAKPSLIELFMGKCAYCERRLTGLDGEIEHHRPKNNAGLGVRNGWAFHEPQTTARHQHLYYSWLAYEWDNLFLVCRQCNQNKGASFPLASSGAELLASLPECRSNERPLLLDPCFDEPVEHLRCVSTGALEPLSDRGEVTLMVLKLNSPDLVDGRKQAWQEVSRAVAIAASQRGDTQMLFGNLEPKQPFQLARRSAFAQHAQALVSAGVFIPGVTDWLAKQSLARLAGVSAAAQAAIVTTRMGKYRSKKMLPPHSHQSIRRIGIRNFKAIEEIDIEVPESPRDGDNIPGALALIGENATGKSSILEAVALAVLGTEQIGLLGLQGRTCLRHDLTQVGRYPAEVVITLDGGDDLRLSIDLEGRFSGNSERGTVLLGYGPRRFFAQSQNVRRFPDPWHRVRSMFDPLARLPNPARWLLGCSKKDFAVAVRALRTMMLLPDEAVVRRVNGSAGEKRTIIFELEGRRESLETLSEGYKTVIAMGVDVMREMLEYFPDLETARGIVLIDELDTHLHPRWKMRIVQLLRRALPKVQFLASTHDPLCLRGYYNNEVQVLRRDQRGVVERVVDLPSVEGLSVQQLLTSEFFGLYSTEDPALDETMARYSTLISKPGRTELEQLELERQRVEVAQKLLLGSTPAERIGQNAIREYLLERQSIQEGYVSQLSSEAAVRAIDIWKSLDDDEALPGEASDTQ